MGWLFPHVTPSQAVAEDLVSSRVSSLSFRNILDDFQVNSKSKCTSFQFVSQYYTGPILLSFIFIRNFNFCNLSDQYTQDWINLSQSFPGGSVVKNPPTMQETQERQVWSLGWEGPLEEDLVTPLQYSCLKNPMDRVGWQATVHRIAKSWMQLSMHTYIQLFCFPSYQQ